MDFKVAAIGDSITFGYPFTRKDSWVYWAQERLKVPFINRGMPGETTGEMRARFQKEVINSKPTHVIILGGTNDAFHNLPHEITQNNLHHMVQDAIKADIIPVIGLPIPVNEEPAESWLKKLRNWLRVYCEDQNLKVLDFYQVVVDPKGFIKEEYHCDGVHPSLEGYKVMAGVVTL